MINENEVPKPLTQEEFDEIQKVYGIVYYPSFVGNYWYGGVYASKITMERYPVIYKTKEEAKRVSDLIRESMTVIKNDGTKSTFDDLVDVAVQAKKDGVIARIEWDSDGRICVYPSSEECPVVIATNLVSSYFIADAIKEIESCYTETFVIEGGSCILKIRENIQSLVLANGRDIVDGVYFEGGSMRLRDCFGNSISLTSLDILKGATVTQRRTGI